MSDKPCYCQYGPEEHVAVPATGEYVVREGVVTRVTVDEIHGELVYAYGDFSGDES